MTEGSYQTLVEELTKEVRALAIDGKLQFPETDPQEQTLSFNLGVYWFPASEMFPQGAYICSDEAGLILLELAWRERDPAAWEVCRKVAAHRLALNERIPEGIRTFCALLLSGQIKEPKRPRRSKTWVRQAFIYTLAIVARDRANLSMSGTCSASDAVAQVLSNCGYHTSARAVRELLLSNKESEVKIRAEVEHLGEAIREAYKRDPIAHLAVPGYLGAYWRQSWSITDETE